MMPNLIHLQKDLILKIIRDRDLSVIKDDKENFKIYLENLYLEKDYIAIPFEAVIPLGVIRKKIARDLSISMFEVNDNILSFKVGLHGSSLGNLENLLIKMINPVINRVIKNKAPVTIKDNIVSVDLNKYFSQTFQTFTLQLVEVAIFENDINFVFN